MKTYKWFLMLLVAGVIVACGSDPEEELLGDWQRRAIFPEGERSHTAYFVIGDKGYVCCGSNGGRGYLQLGRKEVYVFDHTTTGGSGSWRQLSDFPGARRQQAVGFSANGFGYIGTGWDGDQTVMSDFWRYNTATDTWDSIAPLPAKARRGAIAFSLTVGGKEYGYVGTGFSDYPDNWYLQDFWQFDPDGTTVGKNGEQLHGRWTPVQEYGGAKRGGSVVFVIDNKAYICTGINSSGSPSDFWVFDPNGENLWAKKRPINDSNQDEDYDDDYKALPRSYGMAFTAPVEGKMRGHIALGSGNFTVWEYDHDADLWTQRTSFYNYRTTQSRTGSIAFSFPNTERAFVGLGLAGTTAYMDDLWEFIPMVEDYTYDDNQ